MCELCDAKERIRDLEHDKIRTLYSTGKFTYRKLADHLKVGKGAVDFVLRGLTWVNVR
jgi:hypothetical protein